MSEYQDMVLRDRDHREVAQITASLADFLCWAAGHNAALHMDEKSDRGIMGVEHVRRARELLGHLVIVDGPVPQKESQASSYAVTPLDRLAQEIHEALRTELGMRAVAGITLGEDAADQLAEAVQAMRDGTSKPAAAFGDTLAGWAEPGWVSGPRAMWETARECADRMAVVGNKDPRGPIPVFTTPQWPVMPAAGIVGWMVERADGELRDPYEPTRRLFCKREKALDWNTRHPGWSQPVPVYADPALPGEPVGWVSNPDGPGFIMRATAAEVNEQVDGADDWCTPYPVYAQPQPVLAADWPRTISDPMARAYGETLSLALETGLDHADAARAVLKEFMLSHRPAASDFPPAITIEQAERLSETLTHALREGDDHPQATKRVVDEFLRARGTELFASPASPAAALPKGFVIMPAEMTPEQETVVDRQGLELVPNESDNDRNRRIYRALVAARPRVDPVPNGVVEADFAEVPVGYRVDIPGQVRMFFETKHAAEESAKPWPGAWITPLYTAPHPAVLPPGFLGMPENPTVAMVMGSAAARRMIVADENEAGWAKRLYDAFVINRPRMPG